MGRQDEIGLGPAVLAGMGREQQEHITYNLHTQVVVPLIQAVVLGLAAIGLLASLGLIGWSLVWLAGQMVAEWEKFLVAVVLIVVWRALSWGVRRLFAWLEWDDRIWRVFFSIAISASGLLVLINVLYYLAGDWQGPDVARVGGGIGLAVMCIMLLWRLGNELWNPSYPKSPFVRMLEGFFSRIGVEAEPVVHVRPYAVYISNGGAYGEILDIEDGDDLDGGVLDPEFEDLVELVELAVRRGLGRAALVTQPRHLMRSGQALTRPYYDKLMARLSTEWHLVDRGGDGQATAWQVDPETAAQILRAVADRATGRAAGRAGSQG